MPGWLSQLGICLWLRSSSQSPGIEPHIRLLLSGEQAPCFALSLCPSPCSCFLSLSLSLSLVLVCTLLSRARKVWAPDIRGDPHSFSPTVILRAPSMPRALEAEPAGCLACELRGPAFHPKPCLQTPFRMLLPGPPGNSDICSQDSPGGSIYVGPGLATVPGEERVNNIPTLCLPLPIPFASCKSWYGGPPRTSFSGT